MESTVQLFLQNGALKWLILDICEFFYRWISLSKLVAPVYILFDSMLWIWLWVTSRVKKIIRYYFVGLEYQQETSNEKNRLTSNKKTKRNFSRDGEKKNSIKMRQKQQPGEGIRREKEKSVKRRERQEGKEIKMKWK